VAVAAVLTVPKTRLAILVTGLTPFPLVALSVPLPQHNTNTNTNSTRHQTTATLPPLYLPSPLSQIKEAWGWLRWDMAAWRPAGKSSNTQPRLSPRTAARREREREPDRDRDEDDETELEIVRDK
jgi:hypothetical protein